VKQVVLVGLVLLVFLGIMGLRFLALRRRAPGDHDPDADAELLDRWVRHVTHGGDEDP
jgi:hypothetical protein